MSPVELRASVSLAAIFGLRLFGMFVILPVFAIYAEQLPGGNDLTLVGIAIGAYGLTQAILQIPFGWWSDRYGRKPVIYVGLAIFAAGSFVAAAAPNIYIVILGRVLQGAGAISAAVMAMAADLTREEHRTKAMAMIGSTIGLAFAFSLVASPWLNGLIGVPGTLRDDRRAGARGDAGRLAHRAGRGRKRRAPHRRAALREFWTALRDPQLARLNYGIFALHAVLMALFIAVPFALRDAGLPLAEHWKVYLPVMLGSFVLMLPAILGRGRRAPAEGLVHRVRRAASCSRTRACRGSPASVVTLALFLLAFLHAVQRAGSDAAVAHLAHRAGAEQRRRDRSLQQRAVLRHVFRRRGGRISVWAVGLCRALSSRTRRCSLSGLQRRRA